MGENVPTLLPCNYAAHTTTFTGHVFTLHYTALPVMCLTYASFTIAYYTVFEEILNKNSSHLYSYSTVFLRYK